MHKKHLLTAIGTALLALVCYILFIALNNSSQHTETRHTPTNEPQIRTTLEQVPTAKRPQSGKDTVTLTTLSADDAMAFQVKAQQTIVNEIGLSTWTGDVSVRPSFVSPVEWTVFKQLVAEKRKKNPSSSADDERTMMLDLIQELRFQKLWYFWTSEEVNALSEQQKDVLNRQLREDVVVNVNSGALGKSQGRRMLERLIDAEKSTDKSVESDRKYWLERIGYNL